MGFKAEPGGIRKFSERMDELVVDANSAKTYAEDNLEITGADARIFATVAGAASDAKDTLSENYQRLAKIQQTAATELDKAATMYQETDDAKAERLDNTYPTGE
ncbi:type VII secretion target [Amycolatopsis cihanbeyliensis]|uniref:Excreted virulence factor EspC (Type VII ESX diderm) n=1 Tax=Amycolatopsis cihanbeyliensis TaxID=1128664 RepID=A0A542DHB0_AMYCI|nr:type VII secretion target [Amycolatopsis cihanbeyliensis]TQJ02444.1 excreted virulence factor EspC (type VII ESX diderm) [Amycolatopsis cihanbeyliensis]